MAALLAFLLGGVLALLSSPPGVGRALSGSRSGSVSVAKGIPGPSPLLGTWSLTDSDRLSPDGATDADCMAVAGPSLVEDDVLLSVPLGRLLT